jgi:predicted nucleic-acid-binding protein
MRNKSGSHFYHRSGFMRTDVVAQPALRTGQTSTHRGIKKLFAVGFFRFEQEAAMRQGMELYRRGKATFPGYVIGEISRQAGCRDTVTFDRDLRGAPGFTILKISRLRS